MGYKISVLRRAERDLDSILAYKAQFYDGTADVFLTALDITLNAISDNSLMYPVYENNPIYRRAVIDEYLLFYRVFEKSHEVRIYRVLHGKRDLSRFLFKKS